MLAMTISRHFIVGTGWLRCVPSATALMPMRMAKNLPLSRLMASVSSTPRPISDPLERYATKLAATARERGMTVDELLATVPSPSPIDKASSLNDDSIATKATHKSTEKSAAEIKLPALGDVLDLTRVAALSPVEIDALWNGYFSASERGGLSGSMDGTFYETLKTRASQCPFFLLPLPRPEGIEFFFAQFIIGETSRDPLIVILTPLKEYQLSGPSATPHLTLTHFQELLKSKDRVLMRGELGDQSALTLSEAQTLVYQLQLFYVTGGEKRWDLVQALHRHDSSKNEFNYQAIIDCMTDVPSARECKNSDANDANERSTSV